MSEAPAKQNTCSYCGEAPINHGLYRLENFIFFAIDSQMAKLKNFTPRFVKDFADWIPVFLFKTLALLKFSKFSDDIEKANTFRSKVIWEEARKRGIVMQQIIFFDRPLDHYRAKLNGKFFYFESIPIQPKFLDLKKDWDNKIILKRELQKHNIPVPKYVELSLFGFNNLKRMLAEFDGPVIVKPQNGSRARHTVTNINDLEQFKNGIKIARQIATHLVVEEYLRGYICRATVIGGVLAGFYRGAFPSVVGDGRQTIRELIEEKNSKTIARYHVRVGEEVKDHVLRSGFNIDDVLPHGVTLSLSHRAGQLFGGHTIEMLDALHPSFIPIIEKAASVTGLSVAGFDCIIPDPTKDQASQKWGIIECNTLPFIDVHYFALEGKPRNIAGMIWDMWN